MKKALSLTLVAFSCTAVAEPPQKIDISRLPAPSTMIDQVVVPVPSEIFGVLDKQGKPAWAEVLRPLKGTAKPRGERAQVALLLGTVIAEGFIAVQAENTEEVKNIGNSVLTLGEAIGVRRAVLKRSKSIIDAADKKDWVTVRHELDGALQDVKVAMAEIRSEELSQLVSLGGWIRGTEALATVVAKDFSRDGAELLHQPVLLDYFDRRLASMGPRLRGNPVVSKVQKGLHDIRPLMGRGVGPGISEKSVKEIHRLAEDLVKEINSR